MNKLLLTFLLIATFMLGFITSSLANGQNFNLKNVKELTSSQIFTNEKPSPKDRIKLEDISIFKDKVVINVKNPVIASFADTNSMDPVLDVEANAIEVPITRDLCYDLRIGDIVSYKAGDGSIIIHRIYYIGQDDKGLYFIMKGDNNDYLDPEKVRCEQLQRLVLAILY